MATDRGFRDLAGLKITKYLSPRCEHSLLQEPLADFQVLTESERTLLWQAVEELEGIFIAKQTGV